MFFILFLLGLSAIVSLFLYLLWNQYFSRYAKLLNQFPAKPSKPIVGHILEFSSDGEILFKQLRQLLTDFKETCCTWSVYMAGLHIITPDDAEAVLSSMQYIDKGYAYTFIKPWLGEGLLISTGAKWQQRRKILTPTFHFNILQKFVTIFGEHCEELVETLKPESGKKETNIIPIITHKTLASICETAMGTKLDLKLRSHRNYLEAIQVLASIIVKRIVTPHFYLNLPFWFSKPGITQFRMLRRLHNFTTNVIKKREINFQDSDMSNLENNNPVDEVLGIKKKRLAMLDLLISAKKNKQNIDDVGIREEVDTFMFEGHDTTSIATCMCLMLLAHHKEIQGKIFEELDDVFGDDKRPANYDDLQKMKYLELCIKESLRLYPSVPIITRYVMDDVHLAKNTIPRGSEVFIHIFNIHRNPDIYPDPEKYIPDRFLPENVKGRHPYAYIPFSAGPRNCIGQKYAMLEMKSIVSSILRNFTLEPVSKFDELKWTVDLVLRVNGEINIKFNLRK